MRVASDLLHFDTQTILWCRWGGGKPFVGCNCEVIWFEGREVKGHRSVVKRPQPAAGRVRLQSSHVRASVRLGCCLSNRFVSTRRRSARLPALKPLAGDVRATRPRPLNERSQPGPAGSSVGWRGPAFSHAATPQLLDCSLTLWFR